MSEAHDYTKADADLGHDGVWCGEQRERQFRERVNCEINQQNSSECSYLRALIYIFWRRGFVGVFRLYI